MVVGHTFAAIVHVHAIVVIVVVAVIVVADIMDILALGGGADGGGEGLNRRNCRVGLTISADNVHVAAAKLQISAEDDAKGIVEILKFNKRSRAAQRLLRRRIAEEAGAHVTNVIAARDGRLGAHHEHALFEHVWRGASGQAVDDNVAVQAAGIGVGEGGAEGSHLRPLVRAVQPVNHRSAAVVAVDEAAGGAAVECLDALLRRVAAARGKDDGGLRNGRVDVIVSAAGEGSGSRGGAAAGCGTIVGGRLTVSLLRGRGTGGGEEGGGEAGGGGAEHTARVLRHAHSPDAHRRDTTFAHQRRAGTDHLARPGDAVGEVWGVRNEAKQRNAALIALLLEGDEPRGEACSVEKAGILRKVIVHWEAPILHEGERLAVDDDVLCGGGHLFLLLL